MSTIDLNSDKKIYQEQTFKDIVMPNAHINAKEFDQCSFHRCNFNETHFDACRFTDCEFIECNLSLMHVKNSRFLSTVFESSKIIGVNWTEMSWPSIKLSCPLQFLKSNISDSTFIGLYLKEISVVDCVAHDVDFREADLTLADFAYTDFMNSLFINSNLTEANFINAINYTINIYQNNIKRAKFTIPEAMRLLYCLDIELTE